MRDAKPFHVKMAPKIDPYIAKITPFVAVISEHKMPQNRPILAIFF